MNTAAYYATALYELAAKDPSKSATYLKNLRASLASRGHEKLLPRIWSEYQKLVLKQRRVEKHREITPEMERTDKLLQLYRKLIATK